MKNWKLLLLLLALGLFAFTGCSDDDDDDPGTPGNLPELGYAGSEVCATCHTETHASWIASGHPYKLTPITDGSPAALLKPRAAKAVPRSSKCTSALVFLLWATAAVSGVLRDPGEMKNRLTPQRTNSSTRSVAHRELILGWVVIMSGQ